MVRKLLQKLKGVWSDTKPALSTSVSATTETAKEGVQTLSVMFKGLLSEKDITQKDLNNLCKTFFNTEVSGRLYCFRSGGPYGLVLGIENVTVQRDEKGELSDILFLLSDQTLSTSLTLQIGVRDFHEMLQKFEIQLPHKTSR